MSLIRKFHVCMESGSTQELAATTLMIGKDNIVRFNNVFFEKYPKKSNIKFVYYCGRLEL